MAKNLRPLKVKVREKGGKLTTAGRRALSKSQFALPDGNRPGIKGRFPIDTKTRARNALARVSAYGTPAEKAIVRRNVYKKYPSLRPKRR